MTTLAFCCFFLLRYNSCPYRATSVWGRLLRGARMFVPCSLGLEIMFLGTSGSQLSPPSRYRMTRGTCSVGFISPWKGLGISLFAKHPIGHKYTLPLTLAGSWGRVTAHVTTTKKKSSSFTFLFAKFSVVSTRSFTSFGFVNETQNILGWREGGENLTNLIKNPLVFNKNQWKGFFGFQWALTRSWSHDPEVKTWDEIKSWTLNRLSHPSTPIKRFISSFIFKKPTRKKYLHTFKR